MDPQATSEDLNRILYEMVFWNGVGNVSSCFVTENEEDASNKTAEVKKLLQKIIDGEELEAADIFWNSLDNALGRQCFGDSVANHLRARRRELELAQARLSGSPSTRRAGSDQDDDNDHSDRDMVEAVGAPDEMEQMRVEVGVQDDGDAVYITGVDGATPHRWDWRVLDDLAVSKLNSLAFEEDAKLVASVGAFTVSVSSSSISLKTTNDLVWRWTPSGRHCGLFASRKVANLIRLSTFLFDRSLSETGSLDSARAAFGEMALLLYWGEFVLRVGQVYRAIISSASTRHLAASYLREIQFTGSRRKLRMAVGSIAHSSVRCFEHFAVYSRRRTDLGVSSLAVYYMTLMSLERPILIMTETTSKSYFNISRIDDAHPHVITTPKVYLNDSRNRAFWQLVISVNASPDTRTALSKYERDAMLDNLTRLCLRRYSVYAGDHRTKTPGLPARIVSDLHGQKALKLEFPQGDVDGIVKVSYPTMTVTCSKVGEVVVEETSGGRHDVESGSKMHRAASILQAEMRSAAEAGRLMSLFHCCELLDNTAVGKTGFLKGTDRLGRSIVLDFRYAERLRFAVLIHRLLLVHHPKFAPTFLTKWTALFPSRKEMMKEVMSTRAESIAFTSLSLAESFGRRAEWKSPDGMKAICLLNLMIDSPTSPIINMEGREREQLTVSYDGRTFSLRPPKIWILDPAKNFIFLRLIIAVNASTESCLGIMAYDAAPMIDELRNLGIRRYDEFADLHYNPAIVRPSHFTRTMTDFSTASRSAMSSTGSAMKGAWSLVWKKRN